MNPKPLKPKRCKVCKEQFYPKRSFEKWCSPEHGFIFYDLQEQKKKDKAARAERARDKAKIRELSPRRRAIAIKAAKSVMHAYIRLRDFGKKCISCDTILGYGGKLKGGHYDAGHFRSVGSAKHMEFVEENIHGQCKHCNDRLGGNTLEYQRGLLDRYGREYVEKLLNDNATRKLSIDDLESIRVYYAKKLKELQEERQLTGSYK